MDVFFFFLVGCSFGTGSNCFKGPWAKTKPKTRHLPSLNSTLLDTGESELCFLTFCFCCSLWPQSEYLFPLPMSLRKCEDNADLYKYVYKVYKIRAGLSSGHPHYEILGFKKNVAETETCLISTQKSGSKTNPWWRILFFYEFPVKLPAVKRLWKLIFCKRAVKKEGASLHKCFISLKLLRDLKTHMWKTCEETQTMKCSGLDEGP